MAEAARRLQRGFCFLCEKEVACEIREDGDFDCPVCGESAVECPCEGFERWTGLWRVVLPGQRPYFVEVDDQGAYKMRLGRRRAQGSLVWEPRDGFLFQLNGETLMGGTERLGPSDGTEEAANRCLRVRVEVPASGALPAREMEGTATFDDQDVIMRQELEQTVDMLVDNWQGVDLEAREAFRTQLRQLTAAMAPALRGMHPNMVQMGGFPGMAGALAPPQPGQPANFLGHLMGPDAFQNAFLMGPDGMWMPAAWAGAVDTREEQRQAVPEPLLTDWLKSRACGEPQLQSLEADWQCPICFDSTREELIWTCRDGSVLHSFHHECLERWLQRRNECPTCRRTPLVQDVPE